MLNNLKNFLQLHSIPYESNVNLKKKTWIHRGGTCSLFITPTKSDELESVTFFLYKESIDFLLVGHTSNLYILNDCHVSVVVSTVKCNKFEIRDNKIVCECGVSVSRLAKIMSEEGIEGFEYLHELPGTVGGAIYNNSSCYSNSISALLINAEIITECGERRTMTQKDFQFRFRQSIMKDKDLKGVIIRATLKMQKKGYESAKLFKEIAEKTKLIRKEKLEGNANNLGCTVNRCFINGKMPLKYMLPAKLYSLILRLTEKELSVRKRKYKNFLCRIAGYNHISKYISDKNVIVFMWLDEGADAVFPDYLEFMRKVYKTDKV